MRCFELNKTRMEVANEQHVRHPMDWQQRMWLDCHDWTKHRTKLILMAVRDLVDGLRCGPWIASIWHHGGPALTVGPFADDDQAKARCVELLREFVAGERRLVESIAQLLW